MLYTKKHGEMVEWSNFQNELAVFGCVGSQGSKGKCHNLQQLLSVLFLYLYWQAKEKLEFPCIEEFPKNFWMRHKLCWQKEVGTRYSKNVNFFFNVYEVRWPKKPKTCHHSLWTCYRGFITLTSPWNSTIVVTLILLYVGILYILHIILCTCWILNSWQLFLNPVASLFWCGKCHPWGIQIKMSWDICNVCLLEGKYIMGDINLEVK